MNYLIDTHVLLWIFHDPDKITKQAMNIIVNTENNLFVSMASIWELSLKISLNKLDLGCSLNYFVKNEIISNSIELLSIDLEHLYLVQQLPFHHRDPFDRLLIAQAKHENLTIISKDSHFRKYDVKLYWT